MRATLRPRRVRRHARRSGPLRRRRRRRDDRARPARHAQRAVRRAAGRPASPRFERARDDDAVRCVVLASHARDGVLRRRQPRPASRPTSRSCTSTSAIERFPRLFELIGELGKPSICAANGHVLAGALGLALACDLIDRQGGRDVRHARDQRRRLPVHDHGADLPQRAAQEDQRAAAARRADRRAPRRERLGIVNRVVAGRRVRRRGRRLGGEAREQVAAADAARQGRDVPPAGHGVRWTRSTPARAADARVLHRGHPGGRQGLLREARARSGRGDERGAAGRRRRPALPHVRPLGRRRRRARAGRGDRRRMRASQPRLVGTPGRAARQHVRRRPARRARLPARGRRPGRRRAPRGPLPGARVGGLLGLPRPRCRRSRATRPDAFVLWLDAHGDFNRPTTTPSRLPRRHVPGRARAASGTPGCPGRRSIPRASSCAACATSTPASGCCSRPTASARIERPSRLADALAGREVFVHLDLDVLDPECHRGLEFPAPGGFSADGLRRCSPTVAGGRERRSASRSPAPRRPRTASAGRGQRRARRASTAGRPGAAEGSCAGWSRHRARAAQTRRAVAAAPARRGPARAPRARPSSAAARRRSPRQHEADKLTARERIALLIDEGTFTELGIHAGIHYSVRGAGGQGGAGRRRHHRLRQGRRPARRRRRLRLHRHGRLDGHDRRDRRSRACATSR